MDNFYEKLDSYFALKTKYEDKILKKKLSIYNDPNLSKNERNKSLKNMQIKCIQCNKNGGTIFNLEDRIYSAFCGNRSDPCKLNISLKLGQTFYVPTIYKQIKHDIDTLESNIIELKIKFLFGFKNEDDMMLEFQEFKDELKLNQNIMNNVMKHIEENLKTDERQTAVKRDTYELLGYLDEMKQLTSEFLATDNISSLRESIEIYLDNVIPTVENIRLFKNVYQAIEDQINAERKMEQPKKKLVKRENTVEMNEMIIQEPKVLSYVTK